MDPRSNLARLAGNMALVPKGTDPVKAWQIALAARTRANRVPTPSLHIRLAEKATDGGTRVEGEMDRHDGLGTRVFRTHIGLADAPGTASWNLMETGFSLPQAVAAQEYETALAVCRSFRVKE